MRAQPYAGVRPQVVALASPVPGGVSMFALAGNSNPAAADWRMPRAPDVCVWMSRGRLGIRH